MSNPKPASALRFLKWFCPEHLHEEIEGDLIQKFHRDVQAYGERKAKRRLTWNVIRFFRPGIILRNQTKLSLTAFYMITNYFKVASRIMIRNKAYSFINISGLALGMTGAILLFLWIAHEFSYEQFHADKHRIYKAWNRALENGQVNCWDTTPRILAPTLEEEFSPVEAAISYARWDSKHLFTVGETRLLKTSGVFTDPALLTIFSFPLLEGNPAKALESPNSIVLTESFARQLFGSREAFGEAVTVSQSGHSFEFTVSGILKDLPSNTDFNFEYLIPFSFLESLGEKNTFWGNNSVATFVKMKEGTDLISFDEQVKGIVKKHYADGQHIEIFLYPLTKMRLYSRFENGVQAGGRIEIIRMLGILGVCLIAIACINFINLSTARAQRRSKEVAVRKVTGAFRHSLVMQFLCESALVALGAGVLSLFAVYLVLPFFNVLVQQQLVLDFGNITFWAAALGFVLLTGLLAGGYPALYLSSFRPVGILKGALVSSANRNTLRTLLVVFQFGFAVMLIISVIVVRKQIDFVQNRESGYVKDNLVYIPLTGDLGKNYPTFKNELLQAGIAVSVTKTSAPITEQWSSTGGIQWSGKNPEDRTDFERIYMDDHPSATFGLTILKGRDFDLQQFANDSTGVLLNETALKVMGFENPIGEIIKDNRMEWHVIGVMKDFVFTSPFQKIEPIVLFGGTKLRNAFNEIYIKLNPENTVQENLAMLSGLSKKYNPDYPFEYHFADVEYARKFANLEATLTITTVFTSIAIFIACLGLLGLSTYLIEARVKEIGIRKVLGGSVLSIMKLLSMSSLKPIFIAIIVFSPATWFAMNWWLNSFAYRVSLSTWTFFMAGIVLIAVALITISIQTYRAANANPVDSLRNE
ncbi:MAG: ABC transporter permease [Cyclobacteriaceae bacterium]|nr:ABC transporter permease [Cyclobacteriaceae bacterium]